MHYRQKIRPISDYHIFSQSKAQPRPATAAKASAGTAGSRRGRGRARRTRGGAGGGNRPKPKTLEQLDAEMVDYWKDENAPATEGATATNGAAQPQANGEDMGMAEISVSDRAARYFPTKTNQSLNSECLLIRLYTIDTSLMPKSIFAFILPSLRHSFSLLSSLLCIRKIPALSAFSSLMVLS